MARATSGDGTGGAAPASMGMRLPVALALIAGFVDAVGFLHLFGVFAANQSGNVIFFGMSISEASPAPAWASGGAMVGFLVGTVGGRWLSDRLPPTRRPATLLALELGLLVLLAASVADHRRARRPAGRRDPARAAARGQRGHGHPDRRGPARLGRGDRHHLPDRCHRPHRRSAGLAAGVAGPGRLATHGRGARHRAGVVRRRRGTGCQPPGRRPLRAGAPLPRPGRRARRHGALGWCPSGIARTSTCSPSTPDQPASSPSDRLAS